MKEIIIIGAGLSGLTIAYNLRKRGIICKILEAQDSIGGRIQTVFGADQTPMEMGATWFNEGHKHFFQLIEELEIGYFRQKDEGIAIFESSPNDPPQYFQIPASESPSYRIQGGTSILIQRLAQYIRGENISLNTHIEAIIEDGNQIKLLDQKGFEHQCDYMVVAMPPEIFNKSIKVQPALPDNARTVFQHTQTWMGGSVKFAVEYASPFWLNKGLTGGVFSQSGPAIEMYDHSNFEENKFALKGFLNGNVRQLSFTERKEILLRQLEKFFGPEAKECLSYTDKVWDDKYILSDLDGLLLPHQNNGNLIFNQAFLGNKLFLAGSETSNTYGGYMEGAVISANKTSEKLFSHIL